MGIGRKLMQKYAAGKPNLSNLSNVSQSQRANETPANKGQKPHLSNLSAPPQTKTHGPLFNPVWEDPDDHPWRRRN